MNNPTKDLNALAMALAEIRVSRMGKLAQQGVGARLAVALTDHLRAEHADLLAGRGPLVGTRTYSR